MLKSKNSPSPLLGSLTTGVWHMEKRFFRWRKHGTPDWLLVYTMGGVGRFGFSGGEFLTKEGDIVLIRPGTLHDYGLEASLKKWDLVWAHFMPHSDWLPLLNWPEEAPGLMRIRVDDKEIREKILQRFLQVHPLNWSSYDRNEMFAANALEEVLLWCDRANPRAARSMIDPRIRKAMEFMRQNLSRKISLSQMARQSGLSLSQFAHRFTEDVGISPYRYLVSQRLNRACQLLKHTHSTVAEIGYETGFQSPFYFSLYFKAQYKLSPRAWREKQRQKEEGRRQK
jgi:AraC family transcriptional regulator, arabinose operon regulatory protein